MKAGTSSLSLIMGFLNLALYDICLTLGSTNGYGPSVAVGSAGAISAMLVSSRVAKLLYEP